MRARSRTFGSGSDRRRSRDADVMHQAAMAPLGPVKHAAVVPDQEVAGTPAIAVDPLLFGAGRSLS
jgi:hypothetical protein